MNQLSALIIISYTVLTIAQTKLNVVASVPDLADMGREIGGDRITIITLATGREDLHAVPARPAFLPKLNKADLLLTLGLDAEHAWLPAIAAEARNPRIRENGPGWIDCSEGIEILGKPQVLDRSEGEQHPQGNPHYNIGPQCGIVMAENITRAFSQARPELTPYFNKNKDVYVQKIRVCIEDLKDKGKGLKNVNILQYHPDLAYLTAFYEMNAVGSIEPKAGVAPSAAHLKELTARGKEVDVKLIIFNQSQNPKVPGRIASDIGCISVQIANAVHAEESISSWVDLQYYNCERLLTALQGAAK